MKEFWDERYKQATYVYGTEPNPFFKEQLDAIKKKVGGHKPILLPADGEGRNGVYAATQGWEVTAFDLSTEAKHKALRLAREKRVELDYQSGSVDELPFQKDSFDVLALIFAHFPGEVKKRFNQRLATYVKPGGYVIFEAFSKGHLAYSAKNPEAGGPKDETILYNTEEVEDHFSDFETLLLREKEIEMDEGLYHRGKGLVIQFVGRKK